MYIMMCAVLFGCEAEGDSLQMQGKINFIASVRKVLENYQNGGVELWCNQSDGKWLNLLTLCNEILITGRTDKISLLVMVITIICLSVHFKWNYVQAKENHTSYRVA